MPVFKGSSSVQQSQTNSNIPMINVTITNSTCIVLGSITLLKQFNPQFRNQFIAILAQYIRSSIGLAASQRTNDLPCDVSKVLSFLEEFMKSSQIDRKVYAVHLQNLNVYIYVWFVFICFKLWRCWRHICQSTCWIKCQLATNSFVR